MSAPFWMNSPLRFLPFIRPFLTFTICQQTRLGLPKKTGAFIKERLWNKFWQNKKIILRMEKKNLPAQTR